MAEPAAYARLLNIAFALRAMRFDVDFRLQKEQRLADAGNKRLVFAGIGGQDLRDWALGAELRFPVQVVRFKQAAFFIVSTSVIVAIEMLAFFARGRKHRADYSPADIGLKQMWTD
jgi:hypothetical protein